MESHGVLAHLAYRFKVRKEPLATEALCHLAQVHEPLRALLAGLAAHGGHGKEQLDAIRFEAESVSSEADGRPDLEGRAGDRTLVLIEGKFQAGLTKHQPVSYLQRLESGGTLLFVCPGWRVRSLLAEVTGRAVLGGFTPVGEIQTEEWGARWQQLANGCRIAVVGWTALLDWLAGSLSPQDVAACGDVAQVRGLAVRFEVGLMEWTKEQLAQPEQSGFGRLFELGYGAARDAADILKHHADVDSVSSLDWRMDGNAFYRVRARVGQVRILVGFAPADWGRPCPTPLQFVVSKWKLAAGQLDEAHSAYLEIVKVINERLGEDFDGYAFPPFGRHDTYWWGPLPIAFGIPELEVQADLEKTISTLVAVVAKVSKV